MSNTVDETTSTDPDDDPFEWLGRGVLMDQSSHANALTSNIAPASSPTNGICSHVGEAVENLEVDHSPQDDNPFAMLQNEASVPTSKRKSAADNHDMCSTELLSGNIITENTQDVKVSNNVNTAATSHRIEEPVSNIRGEQDIIVEDVFSVDENQSVTSGADDKSYVVQELFPSVKSSKPVSVPSTIYEDQTNCLHTADTSTAHENIMGIVEIVDNLSAPPSYSCMAQNPGTLNQKKEETHPSPEYHCQINQIHIHQMNENDTLVSSSISCINEKSHSRQTILEGNHNLLLSFDQTPSVIDTEPYTSHIPTTEWQDHDRNIGNSILETSSMPKPMDKSIEEARCPLYEEPLETVSIQNASSLVCDADQLIETTVDMPDLPFGLPMGSPTPLVNYLHSNELNLERAPSNPSASATLATAASTADDVSESDESKNLKKQSAKAIAQRCAEESYALFNDENAKPCSNLENIDDHDDDSLDCKEEFYIAAVKRRGSSLSRSNIGTGVSDEELAISPRMVAYTGFDSNDEESGKKVDPKSHFAKLGRVTFSNVKPKTKKMLVISAVLVIALVTAISVLISFVMKDTQKRTEANDNYRDTVGVTINPDDVDKTDSNVTNHSIEIATGGIVSDSNSPSSLPSLSYMPSRSLVDTASDISNVPPSISPTVISVILLTSNPTPLEDTSLLSEQVSGNSDAETTEAPSESSTNSIPSQSPTISPSSESPTHLNSTIAINSSDVVCKLNISSISESGPLLLAIDSGPCANFIVELCINDLNTMSEWAIVRFLPSETQPPISDDAPYYDDFYSYDDLFSYNVDSFSSRSHSWREEPSEKFHTEERAYYLDQNFVITGSESEIVCLQKGFYHFIMHDSFGAYNLYQLRFGNDRSIRKYAVGNYTAGVEVTSFEVTAFDLMATSSNMSTVLLPVPQSTVSSNLNLNSTSLTTLSGSDLMRDISKGYGIIFDVESKSLPLAITSIELYLDTSFPTRYEVHTKNESWKSSDILLDFEQISHGNIVGAGLCQNQNNCTFARVSSEDFDSILLPSNSRQSLYVTLSTDDLVYQHLAHESGGISFDDIVQAEDDALITYLGASVLVYPLEVADTTTDFRQGGFIGRLIYEVLDDDIETSVDDNATLDDILDKTQGDKCYYYTEESCRQAANELGLSLGGAGFHFSGDYEQHGCYFYPCSSCLFGGRAYFGKSEDKLAMESSQYFRNERRLDCETNVDNLHLETSFWCLFPSHVCDASC